MKLTCLILLPLCFVLLALVLVNQGVVNEQTTSWVGGYGQVEYQFQFQNAVGKPLEGVALTVENKDGGKLAFDYPISEFSLNKRPVSGKDGGVVFHHVSVGAEFGEEITTRKILFLFTSEKRTGSVPDFVCRFFHKGREIYQTRYNLLDQEALSAKDLAMVKIKWQGPVFRSPNDVIPGSQDPQVREFYLFKKRIVVDAE